MDLNKVASQSFMDACKAAINLSRDKGCRPVSVSHENETLIVSASDRLWRLAYKYALIRHAKVGDPAEATFLQNEDFHYSYSKDALELSVCAHRKVDPDFIGTVIRSAKYMQAALKNPDTQLEEIWPAAFTKAGANPEQYLAVAAILKSSWICGDDLHEMVAKKMMATPSYAPPMP